MWIFVKRGLLYMCLQSIHSFAHPFIRIVRPSLFSYLYSCSDHRNQLDRLLESNVEYIETVIQRYFFSLVVVATNVVDECVYMIQMHVMVCLQYMYVIQYPSTEALPNRRSQEPLVMNKTRVYSGCYWIREKGFFFSFSLPGQSVLLYTRVSF